MLVIDPILLGLREMIAISKCKFYSPERVTLRQTKWRCDSGAIFGLLLRMLNRDAVRICLQLLSIYLLVDINKSRLIY